MKAKLEVEMPEGCYHCQFCTGTECGVAEGMPTIDLFGEEGLRPKWCPLIPEEITRSRRDWYLKGYNDAKKERDWIPVSEQLPELHRDVLVAVCDVNEDDASTFIDCLVDNNDRPTWSTYNGALDRVLAWMPLPDRYRPE